MRHLIILAAAALCLAPLLAAQQNDEFNSTNLGSQWSWVREDRNGWSLTGTELEIRTQFGALNGLPADIPATNSVKNLLLQSAPQGTFRMETKLAFNPDTNFQNAGLLYYLDDDNYVRVSRGVYGVFNGVWMEWEVAGKTLMRIIDPVKFATLYLRLSRTNGTAFSGTYSLDGINWQLISTEQIVFGGGLPQPRIGLQAANGVGVTVPDYSIPARFDYFRFALTGVELERLPPSSFRVSGVYPNPLPASGAPAHILFETRSQRGVEFTVFDAAGRALRSEYHEFPPGSHDQPIHLPGLKRGMYFVLVETGTDRVFQSFLVE